LAFAGRLRRRRVWRRRFALQPVQPRHHCIGFALPFFGQFADVDHGGRLEGPDQRLDPGHDCQEADPTHEIDRVGLGVLAGDGDATGKAQNEYGSGEKGDDNDENGQERHVVPEADVKSQQRFHHGPPRISARLCQRTAGLLACFPRPTCGFTRSSGIGPSRASA
jgi:hypothetical protein